MTADRDASIIECHRLGLGHAEIARDFSLTRERVRQIIKRHLGESTPLKLQPTVRRSMALEALNELEAGTPSEQVAQRLDVSEDRLHRILREQVGLSHQEVQFQGWMAAQLGKQFGRWVILAIEPCRPGSTSTMRCRVTARCNLCGTVHRVGYRNLASGASTMCHRCSCKQRRQRRAVQDLLSGVVYPSLKDAAAAHGISYHQAQYGLRRRKHARFAMLNPEGPAPSPDGR